jgi:hypothetical protein
MPQPLTVAINGNAAARDASDQREFCRLPHHVGFDHASMGGPVGLPGP